MFLVPSRAAAKEMLSKENLVTPNQPSFAIQSFNVMSHTRNEKLYIKLIMHKH